MLSSEICLMNTIYNFSFCPLRSYDDSRQLHSCTARSLVEQMNSRDDNDMAVAVCFNIYVKRNLSMTFRGKPKVTKLSIDSSCVFIHSMIKKSKLMARN